MLSKSGLRRLQINGSLPRGTTGRGDCGSAKPRGSFPDCARLKNRRIVHGSSVTPRCPSSAAIAGQVALPLRNRLISFRYGQSWLWNGFGCDVGFIVKASCPTRTSQRLASAKERPRAKAIRDMQSCVRFRYGRREIPEATRPHRIATPSGRSASTSLQGRFRTGYGIENFHAVFG
jgi:hypothetical protein